MADNKPPRPQLTPAIESAIRQGHALGHSQASIADTLGHTQQSISRWAKRLGLIWDTVNAGAIAAAERNRERIAAGRAQLAEQALADAINLRERIWEPYVVVGNSIAGPVEHELELPDAKAVSDFAKAVEKLILTHENLTRLGAATSAAAAASVLAEMQAALEQFAAEDEVDDLIEQINENTEDGDDV
ncbi:hypothetical protein CH304_00290 [Rhodococcus sp. 15-649-1-2]|nr:hypothetical protein [Rhodococcus sp. 15-649-1-2]OZE88043.1 hypothetical protein CH304_00290 [Rhodococcus sp. 15-649-1-2]